jgi:hypothetical protein
MGRLRGLLVHLRAVVVVVPSAEARTADDIGGFIDAQFFAATR